MKGIVTVSKHEIGKKPDLIQSLAIQSEKVIQENEKISFYSKEGSLMNIICALLDNEVMYKLTFEKTKAV